MADTITLKYGASSSVTLRVLSVRGMDDPDWVDFYPAISNSYIDGAKDNQFKGFRRKVRIDCGVVASRNDRLAILYWLLDNNRKIDYGSETNIYFVPQNAGGYENEWIEDISAARRFIFELDETSIRTTFPV